LFADVGEKISMCSPVRRMYSTALATISSDAIVLVVLVPGLAVRSSRLIRCPRWSPSSRQVASATAK
jgi:hypothetical protein